MSLVITSGPAVEPISLAESITHLRETDTSATEDAYISTLIQAARIHTEDYLRRALITQTWRWKLDNGFPCSPFVVPKPPLQSVSSIQYIDTDGNTQTLSSSVYNVHTDPEPGLIELAYGQSWPSVRNQLGNVTITFVAGYGLTSTDIDMNIIHAIKILIAHMYENREPIIVGQPIANVPKSYDALLGPERIEAI